jgi:hypothetical protein
MNNTEEEAYCSDELKLARTAEAFVSEWLSTCPKRKTDSMGWPSARAFRKGRRSGRSWRFEAVTSF